MRSSSTLENLAVAAINKAARGDATQGETSNEPAPGSDAVDSTVQRRHRKIHRNEEQQVAQGETVAETCEEQALQNARRAAAKQAQRDYEEGRQRTERIEREAAGTEKHRGGTEKHRPVQVVLSNPAEDAMLQRIRDEHLHWLSNSPLQQNVSAQRRSPSVPPARLRIAGDTGHTRLAKVPNRELACDKPAAQRSVAHYRRRRK